MFVIESRKTPPNPGTRSAMRAIGSLMASAIALRAARSTGVGATVGEGAGLVTDGAGVTADVPVAVGMGAGVGVWEPSESPESLASDPADSPVSASGPRKNGV